MSTTANIAAKGTQATGITEDIAKRLHDSLGKTIVAIVEISSEARTEKRNGDEQVKLAIGMIEVAPDGLAADHVRELARSFHYERQLAETGPMLPAEGDGPEPTVTDVIKHGQQFKPHPYLASTLSTDDTPVCDVCGQHENAAVHKDRAALADPFAASGEPGDDGLAEEDEPHAFVSGDGLDSCRICDRNEDDGEDIHVADDGPTAA